MKPLSAALLLCSLAASAQDVTMRAPRAKADFAITADSSSPQWAHVPAHRAGVDPMGNPAGANSFDFRVQWTPQFLYFQFTCPYTELNLKPDPVTAKETNKLWEWDVAELFIGSDFQNIHRYREYQVSPQGEWVDLDIDRKQPLPEGGWLWNSNFTVAASIDKDKKVWYGAMKIPMSSIGASPVKAGAEFRMNLYRLAGKAPSRQSIMWTPVMVRSHHTPEKFGKLVLVE
jgi:hypothetical protein